MNRRLVWLAVAFLIPAPLWAQKMERPKDPEVGDKIVLNWVLNNKAKQITMELEARPPWRARAHSGGKWDGETY